MTHGVCRAVDTLTGRRCNTRTDVLRRETDEGLVILQLCPECDRLRCPKCKQTFGRYFDTTPVTRCPMCKEPLAL